MKGLAEFLTADNRRRTEAEGMGQRYREKEGMEEMRTITEIGATSYSNILKYNELELTYPSYEQKKNRRGEVLETIAITVRGQDIFDNRTWQKFLAAAGYLDANLISLTKNTDTLTEEDYTFLTEHHTDRYRNLDIDGKTWLRKVIRLAVKYHLWENKYAGWIQSLSNDEDDEDYICSDVAANLYTLIDNIRVLKDDTAGLIKHILKEPEQAEHWLKKIMDGYYQLLQQTSIPQRDNILRLLKANQENDPDPDNERKEGTV